MNPNFYDLTYAVAHNAFRECWEKAIGLFPYLKDVNVKFEDVSGNKAGIAKYNKRKDVFTVGINLSMMVTSERNFVEIIEDTIPHEIAHISAYLKTGFMDHGIVWERMAIQLGSKGCVHHYNTVEGFIYNVGGDIIKVGKIIHNRIQNRTHWYRIKNGIFVEPSHFVSEELFKVNIDKIPSQYEHLIPSVIIKKDKIVAPSGVFMNTKPTNKATRIYKIGMRFDEFDRLYSSNNSKTQFNLCKKWFGA